MVDQRRERWQRASGSRGGFSLRLEREIVCELLRGEDLDTLSRKLGVTTATLSEWWDEFLLRPAAAQPLPRRAAWAEPSQADAAVVAC
jgi:hypothetical protein